MTNTFKKEVFLSQLEVNYQKKQKQPKEVLVAIHTQLQYSYPNLQKIRVKNFYNKGSITIRAQLGYRRIHVRGCISTIMQKLKVQYTERYITIM